MQLIPDFNAIVEKQKAHPNQMLIEIKTKCFQVCETQTPKHHRLLHLGTYISVTKIRYYVTQFINLSVKEVFWKMRMEGKPQTYAKRLSPQVDDKQGKDNHLQVGDI